MLYSFQNSDDTADWIVHWKDRKSLHYNATAADDVTTHGAEPSAAMVLSYFS